jgi:putative ABC transport system permease protein
MSAALGALLSHWRRRPLQLVAFVLGLALATALLSGVLAINAEARASYAAAAETLGQGRLAQLLPPEGATIPEADWVALRRAGWLVSPVVEGRLGTPEASLRLLGFDPLTAPPGVGPAPAGEEVTLEALLAPEGAVFGRPEALAALPPTGAALIAAPEVAPNTVLTDIATARRLLGREGEDVDRLLLLPEQPLRRPPLAEVAPSLRLVEPGAAADPAALTDSFHLNLTAFGLLSFAVGLFIVHGAAGLAFAERRGTLRTLRALGLPLSRAVLLVGAELVLLALLAGALGVAGGYVLAAALLPDVAATLRGLYGAEVAGTLEFRPAWWATGLTVAVLGTVLATASAVWGLARAPLLAATDLAAGARAARTRAAYQGAAGAALLLLALAVGLWGGGLVGGFVTLGALMLGGALLLPLLLDRLLGLGRRLARGPLADWAWADARAELPGLSLALMALLLAMATNIGVSTMVSSFRETFRGFLDQRLAAELYVSVDDAAQAEALAALLPPGARLLPIAAVDRPLAGLPGEVLMLRDDPTFREIWTFLDALPGAWDRLAAGEGAFVNEQLARRAGLDLGDPIEVAPGLTLPVLGVYGDYGNPEGQAILSEPLFRAAFPQVEPLGFGLRLPPGTVEPTAARLRQELGLAEDRVIDQAALKALSLRIFERTFAVTAALNVLTFAVAGFALLMSLLTLAESRLPRLAPLWALGVRRARLGRLELLRAVGLAGLTAVLALPLGLALAWVLLAVVNVEAFGWRLPMRLFPLDWLRLLALALLAAALAAAWPAWRLARTPPARLVKVFADER